MTDRELRKLSRRDLLELLVRAEQENEELKARVIQLEARLYKRTIEIENAGSMAEAALILNGVLESTDKAAAQYLNNIKRCSERQESIYNRIVAEAEQKAKEILDSAENERQRKIKDANAYWNNLSTKLEAFYHAHIGLKELVADELRGKTSGGK